MVYDLLFFNINLMIGNKFSLNLSHILILNLQFKHFQAINYVPDGPYILPDGLRQVDEFLSCLYHHSKIKQVVSVAPLVILDMFFFV